MSLTGREPSKDHTGENFPVASVLIAPANRPVVMAFYAVARMADDVADDPVAPPDQKLARLAAIEASLTGADEAVPEAVRLRHALAARGLSDQHMLDLLEAFRRDVTKTRYADWDDLMDYCRYSAAPVGRFMLDVHGEPRTTWPASDALCAALQVINHLQDCGKDYREIDRVYVPADALAAEGLDVCALGEAKASPALRRVITSLTRRTDDLLAQSRRLSGGVSDARLALEIAVIQRLAESLTKRLLARDPLSERVHHRKPEALGVALLGVGRFAVERLGLGKRGDLGHKDAAQPTAPR
ncbi:MAG TPA: squalene synthase HpnC [Caulobacteraceae bacterium]|nr:squalene synthase HpnC [Caulobacteraceae bacterium]